MPELPNSSQPEPAVCEEPRSWTPMTPPAPEAGPTCGPEAPVRSEWRGTAVEAVRESARRFDGTPTGFVSGDAAGDRSARAVPAEALVSSMERVSARFGDAGPVYTVRDDGAVHNTVTNRTEYVPVCLAPPDAPARAPEPEQLARPPAPAEPAPTPPETHWYTRPLGGLKMVGGALETVAGGGLVAAGVATSEVGVGIPVAIGGGVVAVHGVDTMISGARTLWYGQDVDTFTSQGLQAAGMERRTANLVDAGIGVVGSLGSSAGTRALTASGEVGAISVSFRPRLPAGHNVVGVTTEAGTRWTHLSVEGAEVSRSAGSTVLKEGEAIIATTRAPRAGLTVTVPVTAARAEAALETANALRGPAGAYSYLGNNCATYAADVMRAGGVATPWFTTPSVNLAAAALRSPAFIGPVSTTAAAVNLGAGAASLATEPDR